MTRFSQYLEFKKLHEADEPEGDGEGSPSGGPEKRHNLASEIKKMQGMGNPGDIIDKYIEIQHRDFSKLQMVMRDSMAKLEEVLGKIGDYSQAAPAYAQNFQPQKVVARKPGDNTGLDALRAAWDQKNSEGI
jgi:hypothetical protein